MTNQSEWPPVSHRHDPITSKMAEAGITASGDRGGLMNRAVAYIRAHPGCESETIANALGVTNEQIKKRLSDAHNKRLIFQSGMTQVNGRFRGLWHVVPERGVQAPLISNGAGL